MLKSAYELAMEKTGGQSKVALSAKQKARLAEIDEQCRAKIAEHEIMMAVKIQAARVAGDAEAVEVLQAELVAESARRRDDAASEKDRVRRSK